MMPAETLELENEEVDVLEEEALEEEVDELTSDTEPKAKKEKKAKKKKKLMSEDNVYLFDTPEDAKAGLDNVKYTDGTSVAGYRVWNVTKNFEDETKEAKQLSYILARSQFEASHRFMTYKNYTTLLEFKKPRGAGRGPRKVAGAILHFARVAAKTYFKSGPNSEWRDDCPEAARKQWADSFGMGGTYAHYLDEENNWKEPTD